LKRVKPLKRLRQRLEIATKHMVHRLGISPGIDYRQSDDRSRSNQEEAETPRQVELSLADIKEGETEERYSGCEYRVRRVGEPARRRKEDGDREGKSDAHRVARYLSKPESTSTEKEDIDF